MNKNILFILFLICSTILGNPVHSLTSIEDSENQTDINTCTITEMTYIYDEYEPEMILTLNNDLRLLCKWYSGFFYAGQTVRVSFDQNKFKLVLISYHADGSESGQMTFYHVDETSHFYYQL